MLKIFNIPEEAKDKYLSIEPISQAIKNSLEIVGKLILMQVILITILNSAKT